MTDEATIRSSLSIVKGNIDYASRPGSFTGDVTGTDGPSPGAINATTAGVDVSFAALTTPGYCRLKNLDATNFVEYGIWDASTFHILGELLPGEDYTIRLSRNLTTLRVKADTAACSVVVEAFET